MTLKFLTICCLIMSCGITGCSPGLYLFVTHVTLSPEVVFPQSDQKKVPIKIGYHYVVNKPFPQVVISTITSVKISDESMQQGVKAVARSAFEDAVELAPLDVGALPEDVPLILVAEIASFMAYGKRAGLKMKWTIIDKENKTIWMDTVLSEAVDDCSLKACFVGMMERTIPAQFQKARDSILRYKWWE